jgi:hypothetical protein
MTTNEPAETPGGGAPGGGAPGDDTPKFVGVIVHRDPRGRFAIRYPTGWYTFEIRSETPLAGERPGQTEDAVSPHPGGAEPEAPAAREGFGFGPDPADRHTVYTVWAAPLDERVVAEDLEDVRQGVDEGLRALPECAVEAGSERVLGNLLRFERIYTFRDDQSGAPPAVRKRKQWLLYVDRWLLCLTWQGATAAAYERWFAMANQSFLTFEIPQALWFFTDRELLATLPGRGDEAPRRP